MWRDFLPAQIADFVSKTFHSFEDYGYYGEETEDKVRWAAKQTQGKLTMLDHYLKTDPFVVAVALRSGGLDAELTLDTWAAYRNIPHLYFSWPRVLSGNWEYFVVAHRR